ncbi:hypothetical protein B0H13DRAFT_1891098 [Mycena leptocephala]|nr:hypothetical protein B0H13DRAFT_1891098 [Mycena leptocephala]
MENREMCLMFLPLVRIVLLLTARGATDSKRQVIDDHIHLGVFRCAISDETSVRWGVEDVLSCGPREGKIHESVYGYPVTWQDSGHQRLGNFEVITTCLTDRLGRDFPVFAGRDPFATLKGCHAE